ncbi:MAG: hypothetical protein IPK13_01285 [Deltaproteobacteria bacterium]|nr:hypothetical protein [Deltaproteobacteria bacterium]
MLPLFFSLGCRIGLEPLGVADAGNTEDAWDGGTTSDATALSDATTTAPDATPSADAKVSADAATSEDATASSDAATSEDAAASPDAATMFDAGAATEHAFGFGVFSHGDVGSYVLSPDGVRAYFHTDMAEDGRFDLYGVDLDGSHLVRVHPPLAPHEDVYPAGVRLNASGSRIFFRADLEVYTRWELYAARPDGTDLRRLSGRVQALGDVSSFAVVGDGTVVILGDLETDGRNELYVAGLDTPTREKLNPTLVDGGNVVGYWTSPDGSWVVFRADAEIDERYELYSWNMTTRARHKLNPPLIDGSSVSANVTIAQDNYVVFRSDGWVLNGYEVQLVSPDGLNHKRISGPIASGGRVEEDVVVTPGGRDIFFRGDLDTPGTTELYAYDRDLGTREKLNDVLPPGGDVTDFRLAGTEADRWVIYRADQTIDQHFELVAVDKVGARRVFVDPDVLHTGPTVSTGWQVTPDGQSVVYRADLGADGSQDLLSWGRPVSAPSIPLKVSGDLVAGGNVSTIVVSPTSEGIAFVADASVDGKNELYYVGTTGGGRVRLSTPIEALNGRQVSAVSFTADGDHVVFVSDHLWSDALDLFVNRIDGSNLVQLNPKTTAQEGFADRDIIQITPDSTRMVAIHEDPGGSRLVSANIDGTDFAVLSSSHPWGHRLMPDSKTVVFDAESGPARLFSALLDGSRTIDIGGERTSPSQWGYAFTQSADQIAFLATPSAGMRGLFAVKPDGTEPHVLHNPSMIPEGDVESAIIMPDGAHAIYAADESVDQRLDLVKVSLDGSTRSVLSSSLGSVDDYVLTPDGRSVVVRARTLGDLSPGFELYALDTSATDPMVSLSGTLQADRSVLAPIQITRNAERAVFVADLDANDRFEIYASSIQDGTRIKLSDPTAVAPQIDAYEFLVTPDSQHVVYLAGDDPDSRRDLYAVTVDGNNRRKLNNPANATGSIQLFRLSEDSKYVVFLGDQDVEAHYELFSVRLEDGVITKLNAPLPVTWRHESWGDARYVGSVFEDFRVSRDSQRVYYRASANNPDQTNLYSVGIDGQNRAQLNPPLPPHARVFGYRLSPDDAWVLYFRNNQALRDVQFYSVPAVR